MRGHGWAGPNRFAMVRRSQTHFGAEIGGWVTESEICAPARPRVLVSPRCHPPRWLEENNYYANLNESRPQPTTGSINIKVQPSTEGRGRTVINSTTSQEPAETQGGQDRDGCAHGPSQTGALEPVLSHRAPPEDTAPRIWILASSSELKGYLRLCQLLLIW